MTKIRAVQKLHRHNVSGHNLTILDFSAPEIHSQTQFEQLGFTYLSSNQQVTSADFVNLSFVQDILAGPERRSAALREAWESAEKALVLTLPAAFDAHGTGEFDPKKLAGEPIGQQSRRWAAHNLDWVKSELGTVEIAELAPDVYLISRETIQLGELAKANLPFRSRLEAATPTRRSILGFMPRAIAMVGLAGAASPAFADTIANRVENILAEHLSLKTTDVAPEHNITSDLGADSLDEVEIVMAIEDEFETSLPDEEAEKIITVQDLINWVAANT